MQIAIFSRALTMKVIVDIVGDDIDDMMFASSGNSLPQVMFDKVMNCDDDVACIYQNYAEEQYERAHSY
jgi:hypothetical protein